MTDNLDLIASRRLLTEAAEHIAEMQDILDSDDGIQALYAAYKDAQERLMDAVECALRADLHARKCGT